MEYFKHNLYKWNVRKLWLSITETVTETVRKLYGDCVFTKVPVLVRRKAWFSARVPVLLCRKASAAAYFSTRRILRIRSRFRKGLSALAPALEESTVYGI